MSGRSLFFNILLVMFLVSGGTTFADCSLCELTGDCFVDFEDFAIIGSHWLDDYDWNDVNTLTNQWLTTDPCVPDDMVYIPDGEFEMGDHYDVGQIDEKPVHPVYIDFFYMSKYEITNGQFCEFLNAADVNVVEGMVFASSDSTNSYLYLKIRSSDPDSQIVFSDGKFEVRTRDGHSMCKHPVIEVSWYGAAAYCNWRSKKDGYEQCYNSDMWECDFTKQGYRLPTEAEWEYAARGGCLSPYYKYSWCTNTADCSKGNFWPSTGVCNPVELSEMPYTAPVGYFGANNYGLFDMTGNVWEFCNDWYDSGYYEVSPHDNPTGADSGTARVIRGGSWNYALDYCRVAKRNLYGCPECYGNSCGFRVVLDLN